MEVSPAGSGGERYILTLIDVATRYIFLRALSSRESQNIAATILDIILDMGVTPCVIQSDNEFVTVSLEELTSLLGSNQIFSTAFRPQTNGVVERSHRTIRDALSILVAAYVRAVPSKWPELLRWVESKLRHKPIDVKGKVITPYSVIHGFFGSSSLVTALSSLENIPQDLVSQEWFASIVAQSQRLSAELSQHFAATAHANAQRLASEHPPPSVREGQLVLLVKPNYEKGAGLILPQADGPFLVHSAPDAHTVTLANPVTLEPFQGGRRIASARCIRFQYPVSHLEADQSELQEAVATRAPLKLGDLVAAEIVARESSVHVVRITTLFETGSQFQGRVFEVPSNQRYGPWERRPWHVTEDSVVLPMSSIICPVALQNDCLTLDSLESLGAAGIRLDVTHKHKSIPTRVT